MNIVVRLQQHVAKRKHPQLGTIESKIPQMLIYASVDGQKEAQVGYVGTKPNSPINLIIQADKELRDAIAEQVRALLPSASAAEPATAPDLSQLESESDEEQSDDEESS